MEPLRVLELYSGIGGMHHALRGESGQKTSQIHSGPPVPAIAPPRGGAAGRDLVVADLGCPGNHLSAAVDRPSRQRLPYSGPKLCSLSGLGAPEYCL